MQDFSWDQPSFPLAFGGLGIRTVKDLAIPAYLSSVDSSSDLHPASYFKNLIYNLSMNKFYN